MISVSVEHGDLVIVRNAIRGTADESVRYVAEEIYSGVLRRSPVETGKFRANWTVGIGSPDYSTTSSTSTDYDKAKNALRNLSGQDVVIGNFLPYAPVIEYGLYPPGPKTINGFSRQAPMGVLEPTLNSLVKVMI
jgi:hypothetical protein